MGLAVDADQAKHWLRRAAKQNLAEAQSLLGVTYWRGAAAGGWEADPDKGFMCMEKVCSGGGGHRLGSEGTRRSI